MEEDTYEKIRRNLVMASGFIIISWFIDSSIGVNLVKYLQIKINSEVDVPPWKIKLTSLGMLAYFFLRFYFHEKSEEKRSKKIESKRSIIEHLLLKKISGRKVEAPQGFNFENGDGVTIDIQQPDGTGFDGDIYLCEFQEFDSPKFGWDKYGKYFANCSISGGNQQFSGEEETFYATFSKLAALKILSEANYKYYVGSTTGMVFIFPIVLAFVAGLGLLLSLAVDVISGMESLNMIKSAPCDL